MFKFFRKKQRPTEPEHPQERPEPKPEAAVEEVPDAGGWGRSRAPQPAAQPLPPAAPELVTEERVDAPESATTVSPVSKRVAPLVAPQSGAPEPAAPESVAPQPAAPEPVAPLPAGPRPATPKSATPESAAPEPAAPESAAITPESEQAEERDQTERLNRAASGPVSLTDASPDAVAERSEAEPVLRSPHQEGLVSSPVVDRKSESTQTEGRRTDAVQPSSADSKAPESPSVSKEPTPQLTTPQPTAFDSAEPQSPASSSTPSEVVTPQSPTSRSTTFESVEPQSPTSPSTTSEAATLPSPTSPPTASESVTPQPTAPQVVASEQATSRPPAPQSAVPEPTVSQQASSVTQQSKGTAASTNASSAAVSSAAMAAVAPAQPSTVRPGPTVKTPPKVGGAAVERPGERPRRSYMPKAAEAPVEDATRKSSWLTRLKSGLSRTGQSFSGLFAGVKVDEDLFEELETALIMSDAGMEATTSLLTDLRARVRKERIEDGQKVKQVLQELLAEHLKPLQRGFDLDRASPLVVMIAGVNGAGKTTSIGKLARAFQASGKSVLLAAGDTFRAAAREQLIEWGERNNVAVIAQADGSDPAAVAFDAVQAGKARGTGVVMVDTAGRLPTQLHLMAELQKIRRVIGKADTDAPHEVLLVVDGNTGQNALAQIKAFDDALTLTGLVVTKLDGTAKGGILAAVAAGTQGVRPVPVYWIGVGEGVDDLQPFDAGEFAAAMLGED